MKVSSAFIELPTGPFGNSSAFSRNHSISAAPPVASSGTIGLNKDLLHSKSKEQTAVLTTANAPQVTSAQRPSQVTAPVISAVTEPVATQEKQASTTTPPSTKQPQSFAASSSGKRQIARTNGAKRSSKRRRGDDSDEGDIIRAGEDTSSSDEHDAPPTAVQTKSGRQVHRPSLYMPAPSSSSSNVRGHSDGWAGTGNGGASAAVSRRRRRVYRIGKDTIVACCHCQRSHAPSSNKIVLCGECNYPWHQLCHDPYIANEAATVKEKGWVCRECKPTSSKIVRLKLGRKTPQVRVPSAAALEIGGAAFLREERLAYLSGLSHAALVDLLVTLSDSHPSLEMFPANLKSLQLSKFAVHPGMPVMANSTISAGAMQPDSSREDRASEGPLSSTLDGQRVSGFESSEDEYDYEEYVDHRLYPRVGNGVRLAGTVDDLDILREDSGCPTFSYALHGSAQSQTAANEPIPLCGGA